jgi:hypothetical protein
LSLSGSAPFPYPHSSGPCQSNLAVLSRLSEPIRGRPRAEALSSGGSPPFWPVFGGERGPVAVPICIHPAGSSRGISQKPPPLPALYPHYFRLLSKWFSRVFRVILARFSFLSQGAGPPMVTDGTPTASRRDPDCSRDIGRYVSRNRASRDMLTPSGFLNKPLDHVHHVRCPEVRCPEAAAILRGQFRWQRQPGCGRSPSPHQHRERRIGPAFQFGSAFQCGLGPPKGRAPPPEKPPPEKRLRECCRGPPYFAFELGGGLVQHVAPEVLRCAGSAPVLESVRYRSRRGDAPRLLSVARSARHWWRPLRPRDRES